LYNFAHTLKNSLSKMTDTRRYFIEIAYLGQGFSGWQRQPNALSLQEVIEEGLKKILRCPTAIVASGRTDAGVHAHQQWAHFESLNQLDTDEVQYRLNALLPAGIAIRNLLAVAPDAHARYDAYLREYVYVIHRKKQCFLPELAYLYFHRQNLDVEKMNAAAQLFLQQTDFQSFSKVKTDVKHYDCTVSKAQWYERGEFLFFHVCANRFLRGMVRTMVGTLLKAGQGRLSVQELDAVLQAKDRRAAGVAAPPQGLYLYQVHYPEAIFAPSPAPNPKTFEPDKFETLPFIF
jgi:tRNA pseudouridine38-40 synthase